MKIGKKFGMDSYDVQAKLIAEYGEMRAKAVIEKTGPVNLWHSGPNENSLTLSIQALDNLVDRHKIDTLSIKNLISVTETPKYVFPGNATAIVSAYPFSKNITTFDLNAGCTGFIDAIKICKALNTASLIVCSETYSKHIHQFNRATSSLFSDGAAAVYFLPSEWELIGSYSLNKANTFEFISLADKHAELVMDGKEVFNFVASDVTPQLIKIFNSSPKINRAYIHQGSKLVVEYLCSKLKEFKTSIPKNIEKYGNFVSATLPILIDEDTRDNPIERGENILLAGFGVGLSFSACLLQRK
jgi:3-oxoacyl-[acyl-carrier-protein] synthase-3